MDWIIYLIKSAGVLSIFYLIYVFLLKGETLFRANRHFLLSGILLAFVFPFLQWTRVTYVQASPVGADTALEPLPISDLSMAEVGNAMNWTELALYIYATGALLLLLRFGFHLWSLYRLIRNRPRFRREGFTYIKVDKAIKPFSFFRYIVFNPENHKAEELQMVLAHEQAHVRQLHSIDLLIANLLIIVQWWNPLTWLYRKSLEENLEFLADNETARRVASIKQYQLALVRASSSSFSPLLINSFYQSFIKKRILMLNKPHSKQRNFLKAILILPALALFMWSFNVHEEIQLIPAEPVTVQQDYPPAQAGMTTEIPVATSLYTTTKQASPVLAEASDLATTVAKDESKPQQIAVVNSSALAATIAQSNTAAIAEVAKVIVRITKNTSEAELEEKKMRLAEQGIELDYGKLNYNGNGELTGISVSITSKNGNSHYDINGDDPISDIIISISDNGITMGSSETSYKRALEMQRRSEERQMAATARGYARAQEREAMMAEREIAMEKRMLEREAAMARGYQDQARTKAAMAEGRAMALANNKEAIAIARSGGKGGVIIHKDTTDEQLASFKQKLASHGVEFNYKKVKRNDAGEITSLKYTVKKNGEESQTSIKSNGKPIKRTWIGY